jgi:peptidyl-prolyl cis-trans isomerase D
MLDAFRTHRRWLMFFLLVLVFPSFVVTGLYSYNRFVGDEAAIARVGDVKISAQEFELARREQADRLRQAQGDAFDIKQLDTPEARAAILDRMLVEQALTREAVKDKLAVSEAEAIALIKAAPPFQRDGKFDPVTYQAFLAGRGRGDQQFVEEVRQDLMRQKLIDAVGTTVIVPKALQDRVRTLLEETREVREIVFRPEDYLARATVSDEAMKAYYEKNQTSFATPESLKIEYLVLTPEALGGSAAATDAELRAFYEQNKARFGAEEQRRVSHILIAPEGGDKAAAKARATELATRLRANPGDFAKTAQQLSKDPGSAANGGDLGVVGRGTMVKPFEDAVFKLKANEISDPIETEFGFHVIRLTDLRPAQTKPFDEVKAEIARELAVQSGQKKFAEAADQFTNTVYEQADSLAPAAEKFKLKPQVIAGVTRQGVAGNKELSPRLLEALFSEDALRSKRNTQAIEVAPNTLVAGRVLEHKPAAVRSFDEVKPQVEAALRREEAAKLAKAAGEARLAELAKSPSDAAFGPPVTISRASPQGRPPVLVNAVMRPPADKLPATLGTELPGGFYVLSRVLGSKLPTAANEQARQEQSRALEQLTASADDLAYVAGVKQRQQAVVLKPEFQAATPGAPATQ